MKKTILALVIGAALIVALASISYAVAPKTTSSPEDNKHVVSHDADKGTEIKNESGTEVKDATSDKEGQETKKENGTEVKENSAEVEKNKDVPDGGNQEAEDADSNHDSEGVK